MAQSYDIRYSTSVSTEVTTSLLRGAGDELAIRQNTALAAPVCDQLCAEALRFALRRQEYSAMSAKVQARRAFRQELTLGLPNSNGIAFRILTEHTADAFQKGEEEYLAGIARPWNAKLTLADPGSTLMVPLASRSRLSARRGCPMLVRGFWDSNSGNFVVRAAQRSQAWRWGPRFWSSVTGSGPEPLWPESPCGYTVDWRSEIAVLGRLPYPFRSGKPLLTIEDIKRVHSELMGADYDLRTRRVVVRLNGRPMGQLPAANRVPRLLSQLLDWLQEKHRLVHPVRLSAEFVARFVSIHPFDDGNGRCGRLLGAWLLKGAGYQPCGLVSIRDYLYQDPHEYYWAIAQHRYRPLIWHQLYFDAVNFCMRFGAASDKDNHNKRLAFR